MLNPKTGERELAYIVQIDETQKLIGYDNVHYVKILGWWCVAPVELKKGDIAVYFEVDSLLPKEDTRFAFMEKRKYRVRPIRLCKVISQGLVIGIKDFPELKDMAVGSFVTDMLHIVHFDDELIEQPASSSIVKKKKNVVFDWLMHFSMFRKLYFFFNKKEKKKVWPDFVPKTDEERIQNIPNVMKLDEKWVITEKIDGCSSTYALDKKNDFYVCSRNIRLGESEQNKSSVWWKNAERYKLLDVLKEIKKEHKLSTVAIQGESYGYKIQNRDYSLGNKTDLAVFHIYFDGRLLPIQDMIELCKSYHLPHVHVYNWKYEMPENIEAIIAFIDKTESVIDRKEIEGLVFYSQDGQTHFKCVSPSFILKYHGK